MTKLTYLVLVLALCFACFEEPKTIEKRECAKEEEREETVCQNDEVGRAIGGALVGGLLGHAIGGRKFRHVGGLVGAGLGASGAQTRCHQEKTKHCLEYRTIEVPNPNYRGEK